MVMHKVKFKGQRVTLQNECGIEDTMCVLVTGVHTGVVDALGGLLLVVSNTTTHLHLCDLQGV